MNALTINRQNVEVEEGFNQFVKDWYAQGGDQIISEIKEQIK